VQFVFETPGGARTRDPQKKGPAFIVSSDRWTQWSVRMSAHGI